MTATITGGAGNDDIQVGSAGGSLDPILGNVVVAGEQNDAAPVTNRNVTANSNTVTFSEADGDRLYLQDGGDADAATWNIDDGSVMRSGAGTITYSTIESLWIDTGSGSDDINVLDTTDTSITDILDFGGDNDIDVTTTGAGSLLLVAMTGGNNAVDIASTGADSVTIVSADSGSDDLTLQSSGEGSGVELDGGDGSDNIVINGTGGNGSVVDIQGNDGSDVINVNATAADSFTDVFGGADDDAINIDGSDPNTLDGILGSVRVFGDTGADTLTINDEDDTDDNSYIIDANTVTRIETGGGSPDVSIEYDEVETLNLLAGSGLDKVIFHQSDADTVFLNGNTPTSAGGDPNGDQLVFTSPLLTTPQRNATSGVFVAAAAIPSPPGPTTGTFVDFEHVVWQDRYEINDLFDPGSDIDQSYALGSETEITESDLSIHSDEDVDVFRFTAHSTGLAVINAIFNHELGDLQLSVRDSVGNVIATQDTATDNEQIVIPVVSQEVYYLEISAVPNADPAICNANTYSLEIENFAAPVPELPDLIVASDSGTLDNDEVTNDNTPTIHVIADLNDFAAKGIAIDQGGGTAGADVTVAFVDAAGTTVATIDADLAGGSTAPTTGTLWSATVPAALADGQYQVTAWVRVEDDADAPAIGRAAVSTPLQVVIDTTAPATPAAPDLLSVADTGIFDDDNVTRLQALALGGTGVEPNSIVRVFSGGELVGQGVATSQGDWEITTEPLDDATHSLTVELEDVSGNVSVSSAALEVVIDSAVPNTPYLDLLNDDGHSVTDNITGSGLLDFEMIGNDTLDGQDNPPPNDIQYRLYWRTGDPAGPGSGTGEVLVYDSFAELAGLTDLGQIIRTVSQDLNTPAGTPFPDGVHNFKLEVEDRAGNISPDFLLTVEIDTVDPATSIDILSSSDSGMYDDDNVTNIQEIAFQGRSDVMNDITLFAQKVNAAGVPFGDLLIIGTGVVGSDYTDVEAQIAGATDDDGLGMWEITAEPLADGVYDVYALTEDWGGNVATSDTIRLEVDTIQPNTAFLDLVEASDSGRNNDDNVTNDNTPTVTMTSHDENVDLHQVLFQDNFKFRIYDRLESSAEVLLYDSSTDAGEDANNSLLGFEAMFTANTFITETLPLLADGIHNLKLEVEDRAGNISEDFLLDVEIDTVAPPVQIRRVVDNDSGDAFVPTTLNDLITNDTRPVFAGTAEANAIVYLFVDPTDNDTIDPGTETVTTVAAPLDGDDAYPQGTWRNEFLFDLNDTTFFGNVDGLREVFVTAEDLAGNLNSIADGIGDNAQQIEIFLDTQGPRVTDVTISDVDYDLFTLKPDNVDQGPTPAVDSLTIAIEDFVQRIAKFPYDALSNVFNGSTISVVGDHSGIMPIAGINFNADAAVIDGEATGNIVLTFAEALPDDRFTLTIKDTLIDPAGNALDGESDSDRPLGGLNLSSGDGIPGGDFVARFTVDSRPEVGTWSQGLVYVDINGNQVWDPEGQDNDATNRDFVYQFGRISDGLFAGNFGAGGGAAASGFDKLGAYGWFNGAYSFLIDTDDDGVGDDASVSAYQVNAAPVAGNFFTSAADLADIAAGRRPSDEIGLFDGENWYLDTNGNNTIDLGEIIPANYNGIPLVGNFVNVGLEGTPGTPAEDDLAVYVNDTNTLIVDSNRDGVADMELALTDDFGRFAGLSGFTDKPVAGDLNLDGIDDIGIWVKGRQGVLPDEQGEFFFWVSDATGADIDTNFASYSPAPLGNDLSTQWGDEFALPIFGNFDPPVGEDVEIEIDTLTNDINAYDVNGDGNVTSLDALIIINQLNSGVTEAEAGSRVRIQATAGDYFIDVNGDTKLTAVDALQVINELNRLDTFGGEGESTAAGTLPSNAPAWNDAVDSYFADDDDSDEDLDEFLGLTF
ncbi:MAG: Ig-like domain-containing protein [Rhodopirellula sp. JB044]|uniref:Ig-like domain-containing protein n=1 Tax=Rhodopirellula sp. JB044 TaxID=3342844 RepID=UPI00370C93AF